MVLIPEKRPDKNGRLVTRHVRTDTAAPLSNKKLPAPVLGSGRKEAPQAKTVKNQHRDIRVRFADEKLMDICRRKLWVRNPIRFTATDAEVYDVFSAVGDGNNALLLLAAGVRSGGEARDLLSKHGLPELHTDNTDLVEELIRRGVPAVPALQAAAEFSYATKDDPHYCDAVEAYGVRALRETSGSGFQSIPNLILNGDINLSDVRTVGASRIAAAAKSINVVYQLERIANGVSPYDAATLRKLLEHAAKDELSVVYDPIRMADQYGADFVLSLKGFRFSVQLQAEFRDTGYNIDEQKQILVLDDEIRAGGQYATFPELCALHDAGVPADAVIDELSKDIEVQQIIAIHEGIEPSMSSGWL